MSELSTGGEIDVPAKELNNSRLEGMSIYVQARDALQVASSLGEPLAELTKPSKFGKGLRGRSDSEIMADALRKLRRN